MFMTGIMIGLVMGLTGAGGALVALPLFIGIHGMGLKVASTYSLFAVIFAAGLNFLFQRKSSRYDLALSMSVFSLIGSAASAPFKNSLPIIVMKILLILVSLYSLINVWRNQKMTESSQSAVHTNIFITAMIGFFLGVLTTYTGLGGGVLMLPIFLKVYHLSQKQAVATSLLAVSLASLSSLFMQVIFEKNFQLEGEITWLLLGLLISALTIRQLLQRVREQNLLLVRRVVFSLVVGMALFKIL